MLCGFRDNRRMALIELFGVRMPLFAAEILIGESIIGAVLVASVLMAWKHHGGRHHWMMLSAFLADELLIKPIMYSRIVTGLFGPFPYSHTLGLPHFALATAAGVLGVVAIVLGFRYRIKSKTDRRMFMGAKGRIHRWFGASYVAVWFIAFVYGLMIFHLFYR